MNVTGGATDVITYFVLRLAATGVEATGLTIANMDLTYIRTGAAPAAKVDAVALAAVDSAHTDNRAIEVDATNMPGLYRVDWPDAAFAAGVRQVELAVKCATCFTETKEVDIDQPVNLTSINGVPQSATDLKDFADTGYDPATHKVAGVVLADTCTTNSDMRGTNSAALASVCTEGRLAELDAANIPADVDTVKGKTNLIGASVALESGGNLAAVKTQTDKLVFTVTNRVDANALQVGDKTGYSLATAPPTAAEIKTAIEAAGSSLALILEDTGTTLPATLATIAGYVDELETRLTAARAGYLEELAAANLPADMDTLKTYCDILDNATNGLANLKTLIDAIKAKTDNQPAGIPKGVEWTCVFFMRLASDHVTPATGKTVTVQISKDGGAFATATNSASEISNGWYKVVLTAAEMTTSLIAVKATETDCDQTNIGVPISL